MSYYVDTMRKIAEKIDDYLSKRKDKKNSPAADSDKATESKNKNKKQ